MIKGLDKWLTTPPDDNDWQEHCVNLIEYPNDTEEFKDFVQKMMDRLEYTHSPEDAARIISRTICILYYRRHPREDLKLLYAII